MDGSWNPRRVNCWPLHVRLGDTLALPRPRKSMHPFVLSRAPPTPSASHPPSSSTYTTIYTANNVAVANPYSLFGLYNSLTLSLSRESVGLLFFATEKGELGGVGDVRLLHYVFLTEPPLTSTLSLPRLRVPQALLPFPFTPCSPLFLDARYLSTFPLRPRTNPSRR